ncbi:MAG: apolipoprotein N-acyltransferase [bacterium]|nr:apolipoprotein N-acyltransferase [bacterium]
MRAWWKALGSGALCGLAFAPVGWWWTLLFAPALWLCELREGEARANAWLGLWWGLACGVVMSWHAAPIFAQEARAEWLGGVAWTLAFVWYAGWSALFGWLMGWMRLSGWGWAVAAASVWTAIAWGRSLGALGFPWAMLALGLARMPLLVQPADLGGVWLVEWLIMAWNGGLALIGRGQARRVALGLSGLGVLWLGYGVAAMALLRTPQHSPLRVAVVQPKADLPTSVFAPAIYDEQMEGWLRQAARHGAQWAVLPEVAEPYTLSETSGSIAQERLQRWKGWAREYQLTILLGARRFDKVGYNSALGIASEGGVAWYDKVKLMAFTEWSPPAPLRNWLKGLWHVGCSLEAGAYAHALQVGQSLPVGTLICVESLFGWVARHQVRDGAQWLTVMANDYWLIGRAVREQYADFCVVRAIETRRWVARASTVGMSGFYAPTGALVASLPMGKPGVLVYPIAPRTDQTLYVRWGDWWVYGCLGVVALGLGWGWRPRGRQESLPRW